MRAATKIRLGLIALVLVTFGLSLGSEFVYDDHFIIEENPYLENPGEWWRFFAEQSWSGAGIKAYTYRPLPMLSFGLNHRLSGLHPFAYHLVNLAVHCLAVQLLFSIALRLGLSPFGSAFAASVFAVHPLQVEPVSEVVGRMDLMAGGLFLFAVLLHIRGRSQMATGESGKRALVGAVMVYGAALWSKENTILLPAVVGLYDLLFFRSRSSKDYSVYGGYVAIGSLYLLVRRAVFGGALLAESIPFLDNPLAHVPSPLRVVSSLKVAGLYLTRIFVPVDLAPDYCYAQILPFDRVSEPLAALSVLGGVLIAILGLTLSRANPVAGVALSISLVTFLPVSNLLFPIGTVMGNRLMYLPLVGIALLAGQCWEYFASKKTGFAVGLGTVVVSILIWTSMQQVWQWRSDLALDLLTTKAAPNCSRGHSNLGYDYLILGDIKQAEQEFRRSLEIYPTFDPAIAGLATVAFQRGEYDAALDLAKRALEENPTSTSVLGLAADVCMKIGRSSEARAFWEKRLELEPGHAETMSNLAVLAWQRQEKDLAIDLWSQASLQDDPRAEVWFNLGRAYEALGRDEAAIAAYLRYTQSSEAQESLKATAAMRIRQLQRKNGG